MLAYTQKCKKLKITAPYCPCSCPRPCLCPSTCPGPRPCPCPCPVQCSTGTGSSSEIPCNILFRIPPYPAEVKTNFFFNPTFAELQKTHSREHTRTCQGTQQMYYSVVPVCLNACSILGRFKNQSPAECRLTLLKKLLYVCTLEI
jgi:hypothetical protein